MAPSDENNTFTVACPDCGHPYRVPENHRGKQLACKGCGKTFLLHPSPDSGRSEPGDSPSPAEPPEAVTEDEAGLVLGKLAVRHRFLAEDQLKEALALQEAEKGQGKQSMLGSVLLRKGLITQKQLDFLLSVQMIMETRKLDRQFGEISVRNGFAEKEEVEAALQEQERLFKEDRSIRLIGEILVERGKMDPGNRDAVLQRQERMASEASEEDRGAPEPGVGTRPEPPGHEGQADLCEELFQVAFSPDRLSASITPNRPIPDSISVEDLKAFLERMEVMHGLLTDSELEAFLREGARAGHAFVAARGTPPQPGRDAEIRYHFNTDPLKVGTIKEGGSIDFKDRGEIPQVAKGDLLAERIPPVEGTPGTDVSGRAVSPPKPRSLKLRKGKGAVFSEDGLRLFAELPGRPEISADGKVFVFSEHKIPGDVDLKSGHVEFEGDVQVAGTVQKGFRVRGGSLTANEIMGADIDIRGDVVVTGGIIGATLRVGGNLRARYVHKSSIRAFGDVLLDKEVIDTEVETSGALIVKNGPVFSSRVAAKKGVEAVQVGSRTSNPCLLIVGTDDRVKNETQDFQDRIDRTQEVRNSLQEVLGALDKQKQKIALELGEVAQQQDASSVKKRQIEDKSDAARKSGDAALLKKIQQAVATLESQMKEREETLEGLFAREDALDEKIAAKKQETAKLESEIEALAGEIEHLTEWSRSEAPVPVVKVLDTIFPYTVIKGRHASLTLPKEHKAVQIKETHYDEPGDGKEWKLRLSPLKR